MANDLFISFDSDREPGDRLAPEVVDEICLISGSDECGGGGGGADGAEMKANKGQINGYAALDGTARLPAAQLPLPALEYKGTWNASSNTPTLSNGSGNLGDIWRVSTAGNDLGFQVEVGDVIFYDGNAWYKLGGGSGSGDYTLPVATATVLGGVKQGTGVTIAADGTLTATVNSTTLASYQLKAEKGVNNGYASLDASGKLPSSQLPLSALEYKGTWNAATNTPPLAAGVGTQGDMWRVTVTGTQFGVKFTAGDFALFNGTSWETATSGTAGVSTVAGLTGDVAAAPLKTALALDQVDNTADAAKNVLSATKLTTPRTLNGVPFDGTADITVPISGSDPALANYQFKSEKGAPDGYAPLDGGSKVPAANLPSYVDDIIEAANLAAFPATGETGKIYVALDSGMTYRWSGTTYVAVADKVLSTGITDSTVVGRKLVTAVDEKTARTATVSQARHSLIAGVDEPFATAAATAATLGQPLYIPAGNYPLTAPVSLPRNMTVTGAGGDRTLLVPPTGKDGITIDGATSSQYNTISGLSIGYATPQTRADAATGAFKLNTGMQFSEMSQLFIKNAYYGIFAQSSLGDHLYDFQNVWHTIRASNCWIPFMFDSGGSGSVHTNLYASSQSRSSSWVMLQCGDFSGEFIRTNLEWANIRNVAINLLYCHDVSFRGLHMEGLGFISSGGTTPLEVMPTTNPTGLMFGTVVRTSGQGIQTFDNWTLDSCHFGAYMVKPFGMTVTGTTARANLHLMGFDNKVRSGHGIEVGDAIFVEGADAATSGTYNGAKTVTAVGLDWVEFAVTGTPPSPADVAIGSDCITVNLGNTAMNSVCLIRGDGHASRVKIGSIHIRDAHVVAHTPAKRKQLLRVLKSALPGLEVDIENIGFGSQRANSHWREPARIMGVSRTANVATVYFSRPHNLELDSNINIYGCSDTTFNGVTTGYLTMVSRFAVSFANTGADKVLTVENAAYAMLVQNTIASISRTSNYATITTTKAHDLDYTLAGGAGLRVGVRADTAAFNVDDALILDVPSTTTFVVRNVGGDLANTTMGGTIMLIEGGFSTGVLTEGPLMGGPIKIGNLDEYEMVCASQTVAAGATVSLRTLPVQRATVGMDRVDLIGVTPRDGRLNYHGEVTAANSIQVYATNPTAADIVCPATVARFRIAR